MADYTVHLTVSVTPDVDPRQLQMTLNTFARKPLARSVRVGITATLMARNQELEPTCEVVSVTVERKK
jgi:hypothetical protein